MQILEKSKEEVEEKSKKMQDFLRMEYLEECSIKNTSIDVLRYCFLELSSLYEKHLMYSEAIKYIVKLRQLCINDKEKIKAYLKEIELLIKGELYERADSLYREILKSRNFIERETIKRKMIDYYQIEAEKFEKSKRIKSLVNVYERLIPLIDESDKIILQKKLLILLNKLGMVRESIELERRLERKESGSI